MSFWQNFKNKKFIKDNEKLLADVKGVKLHGLSDNALNNLYLSYKNSDYELVNAISCIIEIIKRRTGIVLHDNQVLSALVMSNGKIAEMATGEGKTLSAIVTAMLLHLSGRKIHIFTANDYLVERDFKYAENIFSGLGINVGYIHKSLSLEDKKTIYKSNVVYSTAKECCFDFLNQQFIKDINESLNIERDYAIIDEVDYILIEEARSAIVFSSKKDEESSKYLFANDLKHSFVLDEDFSIDHKTNKINLNNEGYEKIEFLSKKYDLVKKNESIYDNNNLFVIKLFENALKAEHILKKNNHYLIKNNSVIIVDENSGRVLHGFRWNDGLHQAVEAKEMLEILPETNTIAQTTLQHFFKKYKNLCGMTGTALTEAIEFKEIYNLDVIQINSNKDLARKDFNDVVYQNKNSSVNALIEYVKEENKKGRPILVGTLSVSDSEIIYERLISEGFLPSILNAKNHENESFIIQNAGKKNSITISTNMAGRGTDIMLGGYKPQIIQEMLKSGKSLSESELFWEKEHKEVEELGGLAIVGLSRSHSRRLDNQLIGRAGRQGDKGSSIFFISLDDDLIKSFGGEVHMYVRTIGLKLPNIGVSDKKVSQFILQAQKSNENALFNVRKDLIRYSHLIEEQSEIISEIRSNILLLNSIDEYNVFIKNVFGKIVIDLNQDVHSKDDLFIIKNETPENVEGAISSIFDVQEQDLFDLLKQHDNNDEPFELYSNLLFERFNSKQKMFSIYLKDLNLELLPIYKRIVLMVIDGIWCDHLENINNIKKQSQFSNFSKNNPIQVFSEEADDAFSKTLRQIFLDMGYALYMFKPEDLNIKSNNS